MMPSLIMLPWLQVDALVGDNFNFEDYKRDVDMVGSMYLKFCFMLKLIIVCK